MSGLPDPKAKVAAAYGGRMQNIDNTIDAAVKPVAVPAPVVEEPAVPAPKSTTAAESQARMDAMKSKWAAEEKAAKGMPKPSLMDRAKKIVGL